MAVKNVKSKIAENKEDKKKKLLEASFKLFTTKGIHDTTVQEIVDKAGVAKGTFYLYFKDKYEVEQKLVVTKSKKLFDDAMNALYKSDVKGFENQLIFVINYVIDVLTKNLVLLKFISKNLSWGLYNEKVSKMVDDNALGLHELFVKGIKENNINIKNPDVTLFMIIELLSATCFTSIIDEEPLKIEDYKPYLYDAIKKLLN